jgi:hypothetical protein
MSERFALFQLAADLVRAQEQLVRSHAMLVATLQGLAPQSAEQPSIAAPLPAAPPADPPSMAPPTPAPPPEAPPPLGGLDAEIVELLKREGRPLKGIIIARRLGRDESYTRRRLSVLRRNGSVLNGPDGYRTAAPAPADMSPSVSANPNAPMPAPSQASPMIHLGGLDLEIVDLLKSSGPLKGAAIARRLKRDESYTRHRLGTLRDREILVNGENGYDVARHLNVNGTEQQQRDAG